MANNYRSLYGVAKRATALLTPEAQQAAMEPMPQDPNMMDPAMQQGMPPQGMDPAMQQGMPPQGGGGLPPEIMQDQEFIMFLEQAMGIVLYPNTGQFMGPEGQPVDPQIIMQLYEEFAMQMEQMQQGGMPQQGMDPNMQQGMPPQGMDPNMMDPNMQGMLQEDAINDMIEGIGEVLSDRVDASLQQVTASIDKKISAVLDKLESLKLTIESMQDTTDRRDEMSQAEDAQLQEELAAELQSMSAQDVGIPQPLEMPPKTASKEKAASGDKLVNLFSIIKG